MCITITEKAQINSVILDMYVNVILLFMLVVSRVGNNALRNNYYFYVERVI